jgi:hypothetical protein
MSALVTTQITVDNRPYHRLSHNEIAGGKRISQHLSGLDRPGPICESKFSIIRQSGTTSELPVIRSRRDSATRQCR